LDGTYDAIPRWFEVMVDGIKDVLPYYMFLELRTLNMLLILLKLVIFGDICIASKKRGTFEHVESIL
jgi:hypothetical protein